MSVPVVSVVTPVYNGEKTLAQTLDSVFAQTFADFEILVVDDGSTGTACADICRRYDGRLRYIRQENRGLSGARNRGLEEARGAYLAFIDQDDLWLPRKLEKQLARYQGLQKSGIRAGLVYTRLIFIDADGRELHRSAYNRSGNLLLDHLYADMIGTPSSVMIERGAFAEVGGRFDESMRSYSDSELWIRLAEKFPLYCLDEFLTQYRLSPGQLSRDVSLFAPDVKALAERIIAAHPELFGRPSEAAAFRRFHRRYLARAWRDCAYDKLIVEGDAAGYRERLRYAAREDWTVLGPMLWVYYALSGVSAGLCRRIETIKKR